jgi:alpha-tubulin suppressor-like RCC1 family protein
MQPLPTWRAAGARVWLRRSAVLRRQRPVRRQWVHTPGQQLHPPPPGQGGQGVGGRFLTFAVVFAASAAAAYLYYQPNQSTVQEEPAASEDQNKKGRRPKERKAPSITSQHDQVKQSWESPGVWIWGSNAGKVVTPDSNEAIVKAPRRLQYFNGQALRDLKLRHDFGAAINEAGNLVLWGGGLSPTEPQPLEILKDKDLVKLAVSADRVIALSSRGLVYSIPVSRLDQLSGVKMDAAKTGSWFLPWFPLWSTSSPGGSEPVNYRLLTPPTLKSGERVVDIGSGMEHCLMLTSSGRVFSAAASTLEYPSKGQMGIAGLTWDTRAVGPYDLPHQVPLPTKSRVVRIAAGDYHSAVLDQDGRMFVFGDNSFGQLGYAPTRARSFVDSPTELQASRLYDEAEYAPRITSIAAGGASTFFTVDANKSAKKTSWGFAKSNIPQTTADVWACGNGVAGTLGTGKFMHSSPRPSKVKALSSVFEFDETTSRMVPIKLAQLSVGATHAAAVMDTTTKTSGTGDSSANTNFGRDVLFWGGNEYYQLGTGKRKNENTPVFVAGLNAAEDSRLQLTPRRTVRIGEGGNGRKVAVEQKVECGGLVSAIYSAT